jgi:putative acetyltransferase
MVLTIRHEEPADIDAIRQVNKQAFADAEGLGTSEADLVDALRRNGNVVVSLVAEQDGAVVGHVLFSPMLIESPGGGSHQAIALGPLAVRPDVQKQGIGSALMNAGLDEIRELGHDAVFLLGHTSYYPRFGFAPARHRGIIYQDGRDSFQVIELRPGALDGVTGTARFSPEFAPYE